MKNNKLISREENIFTRISRFFKKIFGIEKKNTLLEGTEKIVSNREKFIESIEIKEDEEENRLKILKMQYENGEIDEDDITDEDVDKLAKIYEKETEELNANTEKRRVHIVKMLKELK